MIVISVAQVQATLYKYTKLRAACCARTRCCAVPGRPRNGPREPRSARAAAAARASAAALSAPLRYGVRKSFTSSTPLGAAFVHLGAVPVQTLCLSGSPASMVNPHHRRVPDVCAPYMFPCFPQMGIRSTDVSCSPLSFCTLARHIHRCPTGTAQQQSPQKPSAPTRVLVRHAAPGNGVATEPKESNNTTSSMWVGRGER